GSPSSLGEESRTRKCPSSLYGLQWGRRVHSAKSTRHGSRHTNAASRFNGVAEFTRRRAVGIERVDADCVRLQWGRRVHSAKSVSVRARKSEKSMLQWGRRVHSAKSWRRRVVDSRGRELQWGRRVHSAKSVSV